MRNNWTTILLLLHIRFLLFFFAISFVFSVCTIVQWDGHVYCILLSSYSLSRCSKAISNSSSMRKRKVRRKNTTHSITLCAPFQFINFYQLKWSDHLIFSFSWHYIRVTIYGFIIDTIIRKYNIINILESKFCLISLLMVNILTEFAFDLNSSSELNEWSD